MFICRTPVDFRMERTLRFLNLIWDIVQILTSVDRFKPKNNYKTIKKKSD